MIPDELKIPSDIPSRVYGIPVVMVIAQVLADRAGYPKWPEEMEPRQAQNYVWAAAALVDHLAGWAVARGHEDLEKALNRLGVTSDLWSDHPVPPPFFKDFA